MGEPRHNIRVLKRQTVSDVARSVIQDKSDLSQAEASLHHLFNRTSRSEHLMREVFGEVLEVSMCLLRNVKRLADTAATQNAEIVGLKTRIAQLETR